MSNDDYNYCNYCDDTDGVNDDAPINNHSPKGRVNKIFNVNGEQWIIIMMTPHLIAGSTRSHLMAGSRTKGTRKRNPKTQTMHNVPRNRLNKNNGI